MPTFSQCPRCSYPCWHAWTPWKMWNYQFAENSFDSNVVSGFMMRFLKISTFTELTLILSWMRKPDCLWERPQCLGRWKLFGSQNIGTWECFNVGIVIHSKRKSLGIDQCNLYCHQFHSSTHPNPSEPIRTNPWWKSHLFSRGLLALVLTTGCFLFISLKNVLILKCKRLQNFK